MRAFRLLLSALPLAACAASDLETCTRDALYKGCRNLKKQFAQDVFAEGHPVFEYETNDQYWSNTEIMSPDCVFRPQSAGQLAQGLKILVESQSQFAVRGGGHMGIRGSNNIDDAVLIALSGLDYFKLSDDHSILHIGPAHRWLDVYKALEPFGLAVPGGRLGPVGVPGLLLAGGVSYYGNQVGWAANSVVNYEVVLASGELVNASADVNPDLFWALKGGSNNFGIVTRFDIKTLPSRKVWAGLHTVSAQYMDQYLQAIASFSAYNKDPKTHIAPAIVPGDEYLASVILFYDSDTEAFPESLKMFTDIPAISSTLRFKTLAEFAAETGQAVIPDINDVFVAGTAVGTTYDELLEGVSIINSTFFAHLPELQAQIPPENIAQIQLVWQPIQPMWTKASEARGGNPLGLDASKTYLAYAEVVEWTDSKYDAVVDAWIQKVTTAINANTRNAGIYHPFNYIGDAAGFQVIFPGYGPENHKKLQEIAKAYDPHAIFQTLMPGGFKVF